MRKQSKKSKTGRTWNVTILDGDEVWADPKLNEKIIHAQLQSDMLDAVIYSTYCHRDVMLIDYLYHQARLKELRRKLIKSTAMMAVAITYLVTALSIFFGWWI